VDLEKNKVQQNSKHALFNLKMDIIVFKMHTIAICMILEARQSHEREKNKKDL
jgi:hypothetical protein